MIWICNRHCKTVCNCHRKECRIDKASLRQTKRYIGKTAYRCKSFLFAIADCLKCLKRSIRIGTNCRNKAIYNNIPLSQASRERITDSLSNFAIKNLHAVKAEIPDFTDFISDQDCRQNIASDIENCRNFKDLPLLWFIEELSDAEKNIFQVK